MSIFKPKVCLIGDSTMGTISAYLFPQTKAIITDLSIAGGSTGGQVIQWITLSSAQKLAFDYVLIQIGLNDLGTLAKTAAVLIPEIQELFDLVKSEISSTCKIISSTMTPARASLGETAYPHWVTVNEAYKGQGASPFIADLYCSYHTTKLSDGNGNLSATYDDGSHIHATLPGREVCADAYREVINAKYYE